MDELYKYLGYVDKLKNIQQGDYVKITYPNGEVKEGFYLENINGMWEDEKGEVKNKTFEGVYVFREVKLRDRSKDYGKKDNVYRGDKHYIVERVKDAEGRWLEEIDRIEVEEGYVRELHQTEDFYIHFETYLKELSYLKTKRGIRNEDEKMFTLTDVDRIKERLGVRDSDLEEFIRRLIMKKHQYKGVGYVRREHYEMPLDIN